MNLAAMRRSLLDQLAVPVLTGLWFLCIYQKTAAQSCFPTGFNETIFNFVCPQSCSDITVRVPHIKGTDTYSVSSILHTPYPWVTTTGVELVELYADDMYSPVINLPFPFCYYGSVYNSCVVGSNGLISFDLSNANQVNSWSLTTIPHGTIPQPIPYAGGSPNTTSSTYYPRAAIMGAYHDIFPLLNPGGQRKVEYSVVGTAPCRKFVLSFYLVPLYGNAICNGRYCTQQIVLHESTGIIDIHLGDKPVCNAWNEGLAILGLQNWNRNAAVAAPGKNCTVWNETATSYRFTPSGSGSRFVGAALYTLGGSFVSPADTLTTTPGMLDIRFPNICPPPGFTQYVVRTTFSSCNNPAVQMINEDTIITNRDNNLNAVASSTNNACGPPSGTITVTIPPGAGIPPYTYVLDGGSPVTAGNSYTFTGVLHGTHTIVITDAGNGCTSTINITVGRDNGLSANTGTTPAYCAGSASGTITVTVTNGVGPFDYILNGGIFVTGGSPYTFTGLSAGTHTLAIADATGCASNLITVTIANGPGVSGNSTATPTACPSATNGTITATATGGLPPFTFSLDGGAPQNGTNPFTFSNVAAGAHSVLITDNTGCTLLLNINVPSGPALTATHTTSPTSCNGAMDGLISVSPQSGTGPYSFSLDAAPPVSGSPPFTFASVNSGAHTIQVFDAAGCASIIYPVTVPSGPDLNATAIVSAVLCNGDATGSIMVSQPSNGLPPFEYSIDGINWQTSRFFSGLIAGSYTVRFRSSNGCSGSLVISIAEPPVLTTTLTSVPVICNGESNGIIQAAGAGGVSPYLYSIDGGGTWQSSNSFTVSSGNYTITVRDANNCSNSGNITVTEPALLAATQATESATCDGGNNGRITVTATGGNGNYLYSLDGTGFQSSNIFNVAPGSYTVYVRDNLGCNTSFHTTVGLNFNLYLNPMPDPTICQGSSVLLQPVSNATLYHWSPVTALNNPDVATPTANPGDTTWYYLTAVLGRCTLRDTIRLNVKKAPVPNAGPDAEICYGQSYTLQGSGGVTYSWTPSTYLNSTAGANPVSTPTINTIYTLSVTDELGCPSLVTDEVKVVVQRVMAVHTFPFDTVAAPGASFQLRAVSPGVAYNWTPATGLSDPRVPDPVVTVSSTIGDEITYQVTAINSDGCKGEGYVKIKISKGPAIYVPTAFTPNGDGRNDSFTPFPVGIKNYNYFRVYNRWGQQIFSTNRLHKGWDGTINGTKQPAGTYIWMIEGITADNRRITQKGTVTLIR